MKNLPIKIFEKRKIIDDRNPEHGGNNDLPTWADLTTDQLSERTQMFTEALNNTESKLSTRPKNREFIPAVLRLNILEKAIAKSHRNDIGNIFNRGEEKNLIGMINSRDLLVRINDISHVRIIKENIAKTEKNQKAIAAILEMSVFEPDIFLSENESGIDNMRVSLLNFQDYRLNEAISRNFESSCQSASINFKKVNYSPELIVYKLIGVTVDSLSKIQDFEALETLQPMPKFSVGFDDLSETVNLDFPIKYPDPEKQYPTIGILDSGISRIPHLEPWLLSNNFSKVPEDRKDTSHGTFVAGIVVYSNELEINYPSGVEGCYIFDAAIIPDRKKDNIDESDLVEHIREAVSSNQDIKIWNLSLGSKQESDLHNFSLFGIALDQIQNENNIVICKSAGNCTNFLDKNPVSRIARSADSILSLVIGSIAHDKNEFDESEVNYPSPFSRIGTGPAYINKPELTHIGGNAGLHPVLRKLVTTGVKSFGIDGKINQNIGTSFSTPRVTSLLGGIHNALSETFDPLLLKALVIHSAKYPTHVLIPPKERIKMMGYGVPEILENVLYNDPYEITLILQDSLTKGSWVQMLDFPFPDELIENGKFYGEITVTLVTHPMFGEGQGGEYCQSNIEVRFGTHNGTRQTGRTTNPISHNGGQNILSSSLYSAGYRGATSGNFARERTLIQYGDKFHPVKKYAVNLEEMTPANSDRLLTAPKYWYLEVEGLFREYISSRSIIDGIPLTQDYCLIVTIRDNKRKHNVYNSTTNLLNTRGFIHNDISLRANARVQISS